MTAPGPDLDALERLLEEATQGPWSVEPFPRGEGTWYGRVRGVYNGHSCVVANVDDINDTHLIAAAIHALPALIAAAREREALTDRWCKDGETLAERLQRERDETGWLMGLLAAERQRAEQAEQEAEKWRGAASVLCGAHVGVPQASCPVCRAEAAEAKLAEVEATLAGAADTYRASAESLQRDVVDARAKLAAAEAREARLRAALDKCSQQIAHPERSTHEVIEVVANIIDAALAEGQDG